MYPTEAHDVVPKAARDGIIYQADDSQTDNEDGIPLSQLASGGAREPEQLSTVNNDAIPIEQQTNDPESAVHDPEQLSVDHSDTKDRLSVPLVTEEGNTQTTAENQATEPNVEPQAGPSNIEAHGSQNGDQKDNEAADLKPANQIENGEAVTVDLSANTASMPTAEPLDSLEAGHTDEEDGNSSTSERISIHAEVDQIPAAALPALQIKNQQTVANEITQRQRLAPPMAAAVTVAPATKQRGRECFVCGKIEDHAPHQCEEFRQMSLATRIKFMKAENRCENCLRQHVGVRCRERGCPQCGGALHNSWLCPRTERTVISLRGKGIEPGYLPAGSETKSKSKIIKSEAYIEEEWNEDIPRAPNSYLPRYDGECDASLNAVSLAERWLQRTTRGESARGSNERYNERDCSPQHGRQMSRRDYGTSSENYRSSRNNYKSPQRDHDEDNYRNNYRSPRRSDYRNDHWSPQRDNGRGDYRSPQRDYRRSPSRTNYRSPPRRWGRSPSTEYNRSPIRRMRSPPRNWQRSPQRRRAESPPPRRYHSPRGRDFDSYNQYDEQRGSNEYYQRSSNGRRHTRSRSRDRR